MQNRSRHIAQDYQGHDVEIKIVSKRLSARVKNSPDIDAHPALADRLFDADIKCEKTFSLMRVRIITGSLTEPGMPKI